MSGRIRAVLLAGALACGVPAGSSSEGEAVAAPERRAYVVVPAGHTAAVAIAVGDLVRVSSMRRPLTGQTYDLQFRIDYPRERLRVRAEIPPDEDGPMGRDYLLEAVAPGASEVTIRLVRGDETVESVAYRIEAR
jgi:hypothetical protein